jgi:arsenate reductase
MLAFNVKQKVYIYHYPKCSACNNAIEALRNLGVELEPILYCERGLQKQEVLKLIKLLNVSKPLDLVKRNGLTYRHLGLAHKSLSEDEWVDVIVQHPKLLQRPIIVCNNKAIIGKTKEIIDTFLQSCQR